MPAHHRGNLLLPVSSPRGARPARDRDLHASLISMQDVGPRQADELGDAQASRIGYLEQHAIALGWCRTDQQPNLSRGDDPLGDISATVAGIGSQLDRGADIEGRKAKLVGVAE
jgi:hypothetical protein